MSSLPPKGEGKERVWVGEWALFFRETNRRIQGPKQTSRVKAEEDVWVTPSGLEDTRGLVGQHIYSPDRQVMS